MKKKGEEVKVDLADQATFEEVQKIVEEQEAKIKEETEGTGNLSPVSPFSHFGYFVLALSLCLLLKGQIG